MAQSALTPEYSDEFVTIYHGDCIDVMRYIPGGSVTTVITDIPYGAVNRESNGLRTMDKGAADDVTFALDESTQEAIRIVSGSIYIFCGTEQVSDIRAALVEAGLSTRLCVWEKSNPSPMNGEYIWLSSVECCVFGKKAGATFNEFCKSPVWRHKNGQAKEHPTEKPLNLMRYLVRVSTNPGDTVLDPCAGSGTTLLAAAQEGRRAVGIELDRAYCGLAARRVSSVQGVLL